MLYYRYQPLITLNKPEIQRFYLSCLERCIIAEQLLHEAEYDIKSYADRKGLSAKAEGLSPVDNTLRDLYIFMSYDSRIL